MSRIGVFCLSVGSLCCVQAEGTSGFWFFFVLSLEVVPFIKWPFRVSPRL